MRSKDYVRPDLVGGAVLVIDDEPATKGLERGVLLLQAPQGERVLRIVHGRTFDDIITLLRAWPPLRSNWERLYLDYDLGEKSPGNPVNIFAIIHYIERYGYEHTGPMEELSAVVITTRNPHGRLQWVQALEKYYEIL